MVSEQKDFREADRPLQRQTPRVLHFGSCRLDQQNAQLWRENRALRLTPKALHALHYLASHPGQLVTKDELFQAVWPQTVVSGTTLTSCIKEIRKVLEDDAKAPRYIETVHRRGYRWIAETRGVEREACPPSSPVSSFPSQASHQAFNIVDREAELTQLHGWLERARAGERQIVFVTGEPGIGKTTVVETFLSQIATAQEPVWIGRGQCIEQYGAGEAYMPVLEALGRLCREAEGERLVALLRQYAPTWLLQMPALLSEAEREELQHQVQGTTHERMLREMAEVVEMITAEKTLVLWFEDLHWSDYSTLELLSVLARQQERRCLLVLGTYRPEDVMGREHPLQSVKQEMHLHGRCAELPLGFLGEAAIEEYLTSRLETSAVPTELVQLVHQRTEGNPLFMVNVVNDLVAQGLVAQRDGQWALSGEIGEIMVPAGLRQFIEQQIGRVRPKEREVLEAASVAGMDFSAAAVAAALEEEVEAVEQWCEALARRSQFLHANGVSEWPDGTLAARYRFLHALYQEMLYDRVSASQQIGFHRRIGKRTETGYGEQASELAAELAVHFERGRDYRRAVQYRQQAAGNALRRSAHREAIVHLQKGLELIKNFPDATERSQQELSLQVALGTPLVATRGYAAPAVEEAYARARDLCRHVAQTPHLFTALRGLGAFYLVRAKYRIVRELGEQLLCRAQSMQDPTLLLQAHHTLGETCYFLGEFAPARAHLEQGIALYDPQQQSSYAFLSGQDPGVGCLSYAAWTLWFLGYPDQALKRSQEALSLAQKLAHPFSQAFALFFASWVHVLRRDRQAVGEQAETLIPFSHGQGFPFWVAGGMVLRGWELAMQGRGEEGISQIRQGLATWQTLGAEVGRSYYLSLLAEAYGKVGQPEDGLAAVGEALTFVPSHDERYSEAEVYRMKGELLLAQESKNQKPVLSPVEGAKGKSERELAAEESFHKAIDISRRQEAKSLELRAVMSLSRLWQKQGKKAQAARRLTEIYDWFTEGFDTADLQDAKSLLMEFRQLG